MSANNCLLTKLKGTVNNSELYEMGEIRVPVHYIADAVLNARKMLIQVIGGKTVVFKTDNINATFDITDGESLSESGINYKEVSPSTTTNYVITLSNSASITSYNFKIIGKYDSLSMVFLHPADASWSTPKIYSVDVSELEYSPLTQIYLSGMNLSGEFNMADGLENVVAAKFSYPDVADNDNSILNVEKFATSTLMDNIIKCGGKCYGDIETLGNLRSCNQILFLNSQLNGTPNTELVGEVNNLAAAMYDNGQGRTSGTLNLQVQGSGCTWNGQSIVNPLNIAFTSGGFNITEIV